jgi:hypothetical protein
MIEVLAKYHGLTYLPDFVRVLFKGMPAVFRHRHQLVFCWLVLMQMIFTGPRTLKGLSRVAPSHITEWLFRRLLSAGYWNLRILLWWFVEGAIKAFPAPEDKVVYVVGDGSKKDKRGKKNPAAQKGRTSQHKAHFFGIRFVLLMVHWDVYRIPADFSIVLPKGHPDYKAENELFREMLKRFKPPDWAKLVVVTADAAFASKDNMQLIKQLDQSDQNRRWGFVFAIARTWNMEDGKSLSNLVKHIPHRVFQRTWIPRLTNDKSRKSFWVFRKCTRLRHIGDVTMVLSKKGRNVGPKKTKILVANLAELTARQVLFVYQRRWPIEILFRELKSGLGLGEHQVTKKIDRIDKSIGIAIIAYLVLIRVRKRDICPGQPWSIFQLKNNFTNDLICNQFEHTMQRRITRLMKAA